MKFTDKFKCECDFYHFVQDILKKYKGADYIDREAERAALVAKEIDALGLSPEEHREFLFNFCIRTLEIPLASDLYAHYGYAVSSLELENIFTDLQYEYEVWREGNDIFNPPIYAPQVSV